MGRYEVVDDYRIRKVPLLIAVSWRFLNQTSRNGSSWKTTRRNTNYTERVSKERQTVKCKRAVTKKDLQRSHIIRRDHPSSAAKIQKVKTRCQPRDLLRGPKPLTRRYWGGEPNIFEPTPPRAAGAPYLHMWGAVRTCSL
jgi:hypothetical protein